MVKLKLHFNNKQIIKRQSSYELLMEVRYVITVRMYFLICRPGDIAKEGYLSELCQSR